MRWLLLLGLFGCDAVFGLPDRPQSDATSADDSIVVDAPLGCPNSGAPMFMGPPVFTFPNCDHFTTSEPANMGFMSCSGAFYESSLTASGMAGAIINVEPAQSLSAPRLAPSGDELFVTSTNVAGGTRSIRTYRRASGEWYFLAAPGGLPTAFAGADPLFASTPSAAEIPGGRRILIHHVVLATPLFTEFVEEAGTWTMVRDYTASNLGVGTFAYPSLTPDGLHLVFFGNPTQGGDASAWYAHRDSVNDVFDSAVKLEIGFDNAQHPHLSPDCSRLYFTGNTTVQYVHP